MADIREGDDLQERVNRMYWESDSTVGAIGDELGVSRSALYASVRPLPARDMCPECGEQMVYTNRTSRAAGASVCQACEEEGPARVPVGSTGEGGARGEDAADELAGWDRWREDLRAVPPQRAAMIGGAAALGLVLGAVAARTIRDAL
jgi:hypothetical protein